MESIKREAKVFRTEVVQLGEYKTWMNHYLQDNLDIILNEAIPNNWDCLFILFGREGCGKTTLGTQACKFLSKEFSLVTTVFTPDQFTIACETAPPESAILWDEAITGANSANHATKISIQIISQLTQIRKKKLKIFLCFPYLDLLNKYFIKRCTGGIYIYAKGYTKRGYAKFYNYNQLAFLYGLMKEKYKFVPNIAVQNCSYSFDFKFSKCFCLDEVEYDKKKEKSRKDFIAESEGGSDSKVSVGTVSCHHPPSSIRYNKTEETWTCRRCGALFTSNPFMKAQSTKGESEGLLIKTTRQRGGVEE